MIVGSTTVINSSSFNGLFVVRLRLVLLFFLAIADNTPTPRAKAAVNIIILSLPHSHYITQNTQQNSPIFQRWVDYYKITQNTCPEVSTWLTEHVLFAQALSPKTQIVARVMPCEFFDQILTVQTLFALDLSDAD